MLPHDGHKIAELWNLAWSEGNAGALGALLGDSVVRHAAVFGGTVSREEYQRRLLETHTRMPHLTWSPTAVVVEGDLIAVKATMRVTDTTGHVMVRSGLELWRVEAGRIVEMWSPLLVEH